MKKILCLVLASIVLLSGCTSTNNDQKSDDGLVWDYETEFLIIGAGGSGLSAALEASLQGIEDITLLEKTAEIGGQMIQAQGLLAGFDTHVTDAMGLDIDNDMMYDLLMQNSRYGLDPQLARITVNSTGNTIEWLHNELGVNFLPETKVAYGPLQMMHTIDGEGISLLEKFKNVIVEHDINLHTNTRGTKLITDENNTVIGAQAFDKDGNVKTYKADAIMIATGGFGGNTEIVERLVPLYGGQMGTDNDVHTGDGLIMASELGAAISNTQHAMLMFLDYEVITEYNGNSYSGMLFRFMGQDNAIHINGIGERFMNEEDQGFYRQNFNEPILREMKKHEQDYVWIVGDNKSLEAQPKRGFDLDYYKADTVEELAEIMDVDAAVLQETLNDWNAVGRGEKVDKFGRQEKVGELTAPYYAVKAAPELSIPYGGILKNEFGEVIKVTGEAIDGLYIAGEATCNSAFMGYTLSNAITWGRIAATSAAQYIENGPREIIEVEEEKVEEEVIVLDLSKDGTFSGKARGINADVVVEVVIKDGVIVEVNIVEHEETESLAGPAIETVTKAIVDAQSVNVDSVTGATVTSDAVKAAVVQAIGQ